MSQLFAFRTAVEVPQSFSVESAGLYDPETQTSTWEGGTALLAVHCSYTPSANDCFHYKSCNAYGSYCSTYGGYGKYTCD